MMTDNLHSDYREALIFGKYLIGSRIGEELCERYAAAVKAHQLECIGSDKKVENFILRYSFWIGFIDAALALRNKQSILRKKILVMFAILETVPEYNEYFLPKKYSFTDVLCVIASGIRSVYRLIIGMILLLFF